MSNIKLDIPDITVVVEKGSEYLSTVNPSEIYQVSVNTGDNYNVVVDNPVAIVTNGSGSYLTVADYASTASYALFAQSIVAGGAVVYDTISASNAYFGNLIVSQSITANLFTGSFSGDGSRLTGVGLSGGTNQYIPLWTGTSTLSSSLLFQTGSSLLLGSTDHHTPEAPDRLGVYAGITDSYNLISAHGEVDSYLQLNVKNFSTGAFASSDIVATTDSGTEAYGYINMGINGTGYLGGGDSIGTADDAYLYMAGDGDLLIGNTSADRRVIIFNGAGAAINNARIFIDTQGFVGINTSTPSSAATEALAVQAIPESINIISARGNANSYAQFNIKNDSNGVDASSDIVATADNGTETVNYINMGINSSQFAGLIGGPNDAYLYSTGSMLHIGNATPDQHIMFFAGSTDVEESRKLTLEANNLHTLTGSLDISGSISTLSGIINNLTASFAMTASYVSGAASTWDTLANKPVGLVSSSTQINTGSFSGSFTGALLGTSSFAVSASYAPTILPSGTISSSAQVDYSAIQNKPTTIPTASYVLNAVSASVASTASLVEYANVVNKPTLVSSSTQINTGSFTGSFTGVLLGTGSWAISSSYVLPTGLPSGIISSSAQVVIALPIGTVSSSIQINTGSFSGSFRGTLIGTSSLANTASYIEYANVVNKPTLVSSSTQINTGSFTGSFVGTHTGSLFGTASWAISSSYILPTGLPAGIISSSTQLPIGTVSSSTQINTGSFTGSFIGTLLGTSSWANNAISSSFAMTASYVSGAASSWETIVNKPSGLVSSSTQINTGSFSGSFTGTLLGTASWASNVISSSFATTASAATSITFIPQSASFATTASYVANATLPSGLVSSSSQINTGSFTGSFIGTHTGSLFGTASWAISSSYVLPSGLPGGTVSSSAQATTWSVATASYVSGGMVIIALPTDGAYGGSAGNVSGISSGDKAEDAFDKIETILGKLAPAKPANLSTRTLTTNATVYSAYSASGVTPTLYSGVTLNARPTSSWTFVAATSGSTTTLSYDGDAGVLQAEVDGVVSVASQDIMTITSDVGTFGNLIVNQDLDPYNGTFGQQGFWKGFIASVAPTASLALGPHTSRLLHSTTGNTPVFTWYLDNATTPAITSITGSSTGGTTRYVSGVPTLATGETVIILVTASNAISQFYNQTRIFSAVGNNSVASSNNATLPVIPPASASIASASITLTILTNAFTAASTYTGTVFNAAGTSVASTWTPTRPIRVDTISNESARCRSGIGWYPAISSSVSGAGALWTASVNLTGSRELQMSNNLYQYPSSTDYATNYPLPGPDYRTLVAETTSSFPGEAVRWVTFSGSAAAASNISVVFNTTTNFVGVQTTGSMRLYVLVSGSTPTNGWIDGATSYPGTGNPNNNGDPALVVGSSTTTTKIITFGSAVKTGTVFVRVGIPSSSLAGSTRTFSGVTITQV